MADNPNININVDPQEVYGIICPGCQAKMRDLVRGKVRELLLDDMLDTAVNQTLTRILPDSKPPARVLPAERNLPAEK
jgi:hypothetical protein